MATVNELITALGFKLNPDSTANVKKIDDGLKTISNAAKKLSGLFVGLKGAVDYFTSTVMKDSQELINLSKITGFGVETLQQWKYAAEASGVSAKSFIGDIENMRKTLLYTEKDIYRLADQLASMDRRTATQWAKKLGISDETLIMMRKGSKEIKRLMNEAYVIPEKAIQQTAEFNEKFKGIKQNLVSMKNEIFMAVSPVLVDMIKKFQKWIEQNKEFIKLKLANVIKGITIGFERFVNIMGTVIDRIWSFLEATGLVTENTPEVEKVATLVTAALIAMVSTSILSGVATLAIGISNIVKAFWTLGSFLTKGAIIAPIKAIANGFSSLAGIFKGGGLMASIKGFGSAVSKALGPIIAIIDSVMAGYEFLTKGVANTIQDWKDNWSWYDWLNPAKLAGVGLGWLGENAVDLLNPVQPAQMQLPAGTVNTSNASYDSHNTLNMFMTTPQQPQNILGKYYFNMPSNAGGWAPTFTP